MRHKRKNNKWRSALWALLSLILIGAVPVSAGSESAQNSGKGTVVFTERAIGGGPYRINVMLTKTISEEEPPFIVLTEENGYSGSLNVAAGQYNVRATIVERDAPDDAAASAVNATVYVTAGLDQSVTVYVGTVEDLKKAGAYFGEGDTGYGKTVKEPESAGWEGEESAVPASGISEQDSEVDFEELPEEKKSILENVWGFRYLGISIVVIALALFGLPRLSGRDRGGDEEESAIWKD